MSHEMMELWGGMETSADADLMREMIGCAAGRLMEPEVGGLTGATHGEKSAEGAVECNRYRDWESRAGTVGLCVPTL